MKRIAISTWCTDDYAQILSVERLTRSIKYFHPEVDHIVVGTQETTAIKGRYPWLDYIWMMAPTCIPYADMYDMIIHIDADSVVVGPLDELFESTEDVIGVRNNNDLGMAGAHPGITIPHLAPWGNGSYLDTSQFLNAGLVGINRMEFLYDWLELNSMCSFSRPPFLADENDTLNQLFYWDKYSSKVIDQAGSGISYGISNLWGSNNNHWESWSKLYVMDNNLCINSPSDGNPTKVKVLHQAGGSLASQFNHSVGFYPWLYSVVSPEARDYIATVTG